MSLNKKNAKNMEKKIAAFIGGHRPSKASSGVAEPDVISPKFVAECKHRKSLPKWFKGAFEQVDKHRKDYTHHTPIVVLHEKNQPHQDDYVVMSLEDLRRLFIYEGVKDGLT